MSTNGTTRNLYQRIAAITAAVQVKATGKTAHGQQTISITDVEDALGELTAEHGVVTDYRWNEAPTVIGNEGKMSLWLAHITACLVNADIPEDRVEAELYDVGTSPSAAVSFALKRYYRALFHLATEEDEKRSVGAGQAQQPRDDKKRSAPPADPPPAAKPTLTAEQRAELTALNDALPEDLRLTPEGKKALIAEGFEAAKEALLAREEEAEESRRAIMNPQPSLLPETAEVGTA